MLPVHVLLITLALPVMTSAVGPVEVCQTQELYAFCAPGQFVVITSAYLGRMQIGKCVATDYGYVGCEVDVTSVLERRCSGRRECRVFIPDAELDALSECPLEFETYLEVTYNCYFETLELRLAGGLNATAGRLEVYHDGQWGCICDYNWDDSYCALVCDQMGFSGGLLVSPSQYGKCPGVTWLDDVTCYGHETRLDQCSHGIWFRQNCYHFGEVACMCDNVPPDSLILRLAGGPNATAGRLEVYHDGQWGSICANNWEDSYCALVCDQMGFSGGLLVSPSQYGKCPGVIWLDEVTCHGHETRLDQCSHGIWGRHICNHFEEVACVCDNVSEGRDIIAGRDIVAVILLIVIGVIIYGLLNLDCDKLQQWWNRATSFMALLSGNPGRPECAHNNASQCHYTLLDALPDLATDRSPGVGIPDADPPPSYWVACGQPPVYTDNVAPGSLSDGEVHHVGVAVPSDTGSPEPPPSYDEALAIEAQRIDRRDL